MPKYKVCSKHGVYMVQNGQLDRCPECDHKPSKKSKKYGGKAIIVPPHMKASDWQVKDNMKWEDNCPLPKNEEFKRCHGLNW